MLRLQTPLVNPPGLLLRWSSDTNRAYFVQRATSLNSPLSFTTLQGDIPGLPNTTSFTDTNTLASGPAFYRVGVQP